MKKPQLLPDWKSVLKKAWSIRWMIAAVLASGTETGFLLAQPFLETKLPQGVFAGLAGIFTSVALVTRLMYQPEKKGGGL